MDEIQIERQVARGKGSTGQVLGLGAGGRHVKDRQVEEGDCRMVALDKGHSLPRLVDGFGRRAEEQVDVGGDPGLVQGCEHPFRQFQPYPLVHGVQYALISRFQAQLEQNAARGAQPPAEVDIGQLLMEADKAVPGWAGWLVGQCLEQRRAEGVVEQVNQGGLDGLAELSQLTDDGLRRYGLVAVVLGIFRAKGATVPVAAARGGERKNRAGGEVVGKRQVAVVGGYVFSLPLIAQEAQQGFLSGALDTAVDQTGKGIIPVRAGHPGTEQATTERELYFRPALLDVAKKSEGAGRLTEIAEREPDPFGLQRLQHGRQASIHPEKIGIAFGMLGRLEQVIAGERIGFVLIIAQIETYGRPLPRQQFQCSVEVAYCPLVAIDIAIEVRAMQGEDVAVAMSEGAF